MSSLDVFVTALPLGSMPLQCLLHIVGSGLAATRAYDSSSKFHIMYCRYGTVHLDLRFCHQSIEIGSLREGQERQAPPSQDTVSANCFEDAPATDPGNRSQVAHQL